MNRNFKLAAIGLVIGLIITPIIAMMLNLGFAVIVMLEIAVIAFFTVIFVMIIGSVQDHYPKDAKDSSAVSAWAQRLGTTEDKQQTAED
ncbi:MAG: hypothetical protein ACFE0Q_11230 [Anaerolineae bacterium]